MKVKEQHHRMRNRRGYKRAIILREELGGTTGGGLDVPRAK
jgi:hypothetical protein